MKNGNWKSRRWKKPWESRTFFSIHLFRSLAHSFPSACVVVTVCHWSKRVDPLLDHVCMQCFLFYPEIAAVVDFVFSEIFPSMLFFLARKLALFAALFMHTIQFNLSLVINKTMSTAEKYARISHILGGSGGWVSTPLAKTDNESMRREKMMRRMKHWKNANEWKMEKWCCKKWWKNFDRDCVVIENANIRERKKLFAHIEVEWEKNQQSLKV